QAPAASRRAPSTEASQALHHVAHLARRRREAIVTDPVARLLETYAEGLEAQPHEATNINRLEQRVRGTLRERSAARKRTVTRLQGALSLGGGLPPGFGRVGLPTG